MMTGGSTRLQPKIVAGPCTAAMHYHVLGAGSIGSLFAHHLASRGNNVTLLLRSRERLQEFTQHHGSSIHLAPSPGAALLPVPVKAELVTPNAAYPAADAPIDNLLVATKAHVTASALASMRQRLHPLSCVVLLQNGVLGVHDQLCREVWGRHCLSACMACLAAPLSASLFCALTIPVGVPCNHCISSPCTACVAFCHLV
jgi:ketopantoate reductase